MNRGQRKTAKYELRKRKRDDAYARGRRRRDERRTVGIGSPQRVRRRVERRARVASFIKNVADHPLAQQAITGAISKYLG